MKRWWAGGTVVELAENVATYLYQLSKCGASREKAVRLVRDRFGVDVSELVKDWRSDRSSEDG